MSVGAEKPDWKLLIYKNAYGEFSRFDFDGVWRELFGIQVHGLLQAKR